MPLIGPVVGEQQLRVLVDDRHLHRGGACIDADVDGLGVVRREVRLRHRRLGVTALLKASYSASFSNRGGWER